MGGGKNRENKETAMTPETCNVCRNAFMKAPIDRRRTCPPCRKLYWQGSSPIVDESQVILDDTTTANLVETFMLPDIPIDTSSGFTADTGPADTSTPDAPSPDFGGGDFGGGGAGGDY
jgi:hypothetical protein